MMGVELIDSGLVRNKSYMDLVKDIRNSITGINKDDGTVTTLSDFSLFHKNLVSNPSRYVLAQTDLREVFQKLQDQGKFVFILSNSHAEQIEIVMKVTLGADWRKFFNMIILDAHKSHFF